MKIASLIRDDDRLIPAEVEVLLLPGLPVIHVLGLPDQAIKESIHRVRSALRAQGFDWPQARQILVNVRPVDRRKSSRGLEFAIAAALIWETGQRPKPLLQSGFYVYGELTLSGEVLEPGDLAEDFRFQPGDLVLTGSGKSARGFDRDRVKTLADLDQPQRDTALHPLQDLRRPEDGLKRKFSSNEAEFLALTALGEFHVLLAGAAGAGKTTLARSVSSLLSAPTEEDLREGRVVDGWRPWIAPHHSASALSLIGGGVPPRRGEISRANGGILFLDELLEFPRAAQEALREPVESGVIRVARGSRSKTFPAKLQLIATTNLCPCGRWEPGARRDCGRSNQRCHSTLEKISGPFFDRFEMLVFTSDLRGERTVTGNEILVRVEKAREFRSCRRDDPDPWTWVEEPWRTELRASPSGSERRKRSTLRVARAVADLKGSERIHSRHLDSALLWTVASFERLRTMGGV